MSFSVDTFKEELKDFFYEPEGQQYVDQILGGKKSVLIDLQALDSWDSDKRQLFVDNAVRYGIKAFEEQLKATVQSQNSNINTDEVEVGFFSSDEFIVPLVPIHDIASKHVGKLIRIKGLVNRTTMIKPFYTHVVFRCRNCGAPTVPYLQEDPFILTKPFDKCEECKERGQFDPMFENSEFIDSQEFTMQELQKDISSSTPQKIPMIMFKGYFMNFVNCGDQLEVYGVVKLSGVYRNKTLSRFNNPYLEVYFIKKESKDPKKIEITANEEEQIKEIGKREDVFDYLVANLAPSLYGIDDAKKACLLALFGGVEREKKDIIVRGNINVLLVGDPSTGKSQLLRTLALVSPNAMYATGKGTTAAGLTAAMTRDEMTGEWTVNAGVLVLADRGIACIDEMDKMNNDDRVNMHEAMEQQTVSISKAGIHSVLMARTAVIAAANPILGKYDITISIQENIPKFPPTLVNRFDLIFILIDKPDKDRDQEIVSHVSPLREQMEKSLDRELFKKYIAYAKRINPEWSIDLDKRIQDYYLAIRKQISGLGQKEKIAIAPRQAEALYRITEAYARSSLRDKITENDVDRTIELFNSFLSGIEFDVQSLISGKTASQREKWNIVIEVMRGTTYNKTMTRDEIILTLMEKANLTNKECEKIIHDMKEASYLIEGEQDRYYCTQG